MEHSEMDTIQYEIVHIFQCKYASWVKYLLHYWKWIFLRITDAVLRVLKEVPWIDSFQQGPECKSVSHTLQSSSHSVHMNVASGNYVITCSGNSHFGLADNAAG